jgi:hypothetical protein
VAYGNEVMVSGEFMVLAAAKLMVQTKDLGKGYWDTANSMCENSIVGGYTDWRLPTIEELMTLYNNKEKIGGFTTNKYWSSSCYGIEYYGYYYYINFGSGYQDYINGKSASNYVRAVRTIE